MDERVFYIDLHDITTKEEFQELISIVLPVPDYYGKNLDALHDILTETSENWNIIFYNISRASRALGKYYEAMLRLCEEACHECDNLKIRFYP